MLNEIPEARLDPVSICQRTKADSSLIRNLRNLAESCHRLRRLCAATDVGVTCRRVSARPEYASKRPFEYKPAPKRWTIQTLTTIKVNKNVYDLARVNYNSSNRFSLANTTGRLSIVCQGVAGSCSAQDAFSYDSMGRIQQKVTSTPSFNAGGPVYTGNATDIWYPDLKHVTESWNGAGEVSSVTFADFNGSSANYPCLSSAAYFPDGSVQSMTLGKAMQEGYSKNNRLQGSEIKVTGSQSQFNGQRFLDRTYSYASVCGCVAYSGK